MNARPVELFHFHNLTLTVVEAEHIRYVSLKPIVEMLGLSWKRARENVLTDENKALFGIKVLNPTSTDTYLGDLEPKSAPYGAEKITLKAPIFIRLDRVHLYLARVQTAQMRANGNEAAADRLLTLQQEWADALYAYETLGIAVKAGQHKALKDLFAMRKFATAEEKVRLTHLIAKSLDAAGCPAMAAGKQEMVGGEV